MSTAINETIELAGPASDGWYRTQIPDWIALNPDLKDGAFRLYCILRALVLEKQKNKIRVLSHEQLAFLAVGKNGKPASVSTVKALLVNLHEVGLISNPDGSRIITSSGPGTIRSRRRYQLEDWPKERGEYTGWRNAFDKLDAFTDDWRKTRTDVPRGRVDSQISDSQDDQQENTPAAGQLDSQKSDAPGQKSDLDSQKSGEKPALTSEDAPSLKEVPQGGSSSPGASGATTGEGGATATPEEEENNQGNDNPNSQAPQQTSRELKAADLIASRLAGADGGAPTPGEIPAVLEHIRDEAAKTGTNIAAIDAWVTGRDLGALKRDLAAVRSRAGAQAAPAARRGSCALHAGEDLPCLSCKGELSGGGDEAEAVIAMYLADPDARPDLKGNRYIQRALQAE